jgi:hypothetical protein
MLHSSLLGAEPNGGYRTDDPEQSIFVFFLSDGGPRVHSRRGEERRGERRVPDRRTCTVDVFVLFKGHRRTARAPPSACTHLIKFLLGAGAGSACVPGGCFGKIHWTGSLCAIMKSYIHSARFPTAWADTPTHVHDMRASARIFANCLMAFPRGFSWPFGPVPQPQHVVYMVSFVVYI